jgi:hypothetical protein
MMMMMIMMLVLFSSFCGQCQKISEMSRLFFQKIHQKQKNKNLNTINLLFVFTSDSVRGYQ